MAGEDNIKGKGFDSLTTEQQRKMASKGGIASAKVKRKKRRFNELLNAMMDSKLTDPKEIAMIANTFPDLDPDEVTQESAILIAQMNKARKGNTEAFKAVRDTAGFKPVDKSEHTGAGGTPLQAPVITIKGVSGSGKK
tara:strand:- start:3800 stop:4213 length:414 start_codon:yes stop_codon:yes gene_type:complete